MFEITCACVFVCVLDYSTSLITHSNAIFIQLAEMISAAQRTVETYVLAILEKNMFTKKMPAFLT